ncbi:hypothetical protein FRB95_008139 [Tulasnella sp. JGI-2019a]|nr:hypothetical protein FRB95_008139 [Tulasnella sp. JGI-2019a]
MLAELLSGTMGSKKAMVGWFTFRLRPPPTTMSSQALGTSVFKLTPISTAANEQKKVVDDYIIRELKDTMLEVSFDSFVDSYLYPPPTPDVKSSVAEKYYSVAEEYIQKLKRTAVAESQSSSARSVDNTDIRSPTPQIPTLNPGAVNKTVEGDGAGPTCYKDMAFYPLQGVIKTAGLKFGNKPELREAQLYKPLITLMTEICQHFSNNGLSGDEDWPQPINPDPRPNPPQPNGSKPFLKRIFADCHNRELKFVSELPAEPNLRPDLALLLDDELNDKTNNHLYFKDVKVGIEVKFDSVFDTKTIAQVARYVRGMKMDQLDRNLFYTLLISKDTCRVFRWDSAVCYVTEALSYHHQPEKFVQLIGRFAALDPKSLGYDLSFSNSGRVHSSYTSTTMMTTLTIQPTPVRDLLDRGRNGDPTTPKPLPPQPWKDEKPQVFLLKSHPIARFNSEYIFGRSTVVWKAWQFVPGTDKVGSAFVIKQNHQDDSRPNEGSFYQEGNMIEGVGHMEFLQELDHTREYRQRIAPSDINGCWRKLRPTPVPPKRAETPKIAPLLEDDDEDSPYRNAPTPKEMLGWGSTKRSGMTTSNLDSSGVWTLIKSEKTPKLERALLRFVSKDVGIDWSRTVDATELISVAHDCLNAIQELWLKRILHRDISFGNVLLTRKPLRGFLIDLGLAMKFSKDGVAGKDSDVHHHLTGTLPFIAVDLLPRLGLPSPGHAVCHDIESLFWVLLWTSLTFSGIHLTPWMAEALSGLNGADVDTVHTRKILIMSEPDCIRIGGRYEGATAFLQAYARSCKSPETRTFDVVNKIFVHFKNRRPHLPKDEPQAESPESPAMGPSQRKRGPTTKRSNS